MAFRGLRLFRRHLILNNKYLFKYMIFLRQFKNIHKTTINKKFQIFLIKNVNANLMFLKQYLFIKNKQINFVKKKNYTISLISH